MNKIKTIFKHEFLVTVRRKSFILMTIAFPLLGILAIGAYQIFQGTGETPPVAEKIAVGYVDETGLFNDYTSYYNVTLISQPDENAAFNAMTGKEIQQYFVIPEDYLSGGVIVRYTLERELGISGKWRLL
jgi:ABC-2 type transport system permease protein